MPQSTHRNASKAQIETRKLNQHRRRRAQRSSVIESGLEDWCLGGVPNDLWWDNKADELDITKGNTCWELQRDLDFDGKFEPLIQWLIRGTKSTKPSFVEDSVMPRRRESTARLSAIDREIVDWFDGIQHGGPAAALRRLEQDSALISAFRRLRSRLKVTKDRNPWSRQVERTILIGLVTQPLWKQSLEDWKGGEPKDLLIHLLAPLLVPDAVYSSVFGLSPLHSTGINPLVWIVATARGASMRRIARHYGWCLSQALIAQVHGLEDQKEEDHFFDNVLRRAEVLRLGARYEEFALTSSCRGAPGMSEWTTDHPYGRDSEAATFFWRSTVRWLAKHRAELNYVQASSVQQWAVHRNIEDPTFSLSGRSVGSVLRLSYVYRDDVSGSLARSRYGDGLKGLEWATHGWNWKYIDPYTDDAWAVKELVNAAELSDEGAVQRHCVHSYATRCFEGASAIFQMTRNAKRCVTIEVIVKEKRIIQARGLCNKTPEPEENRALAIWAAHHGLRNMSMGVRHICLRV